MVIGTRFLLLLAALLQVSVSARIAHNWQDGDADSDDYGQLADFDELSAGSDWDEFYLNGKPSSNSDEDDSDEEGQLPAPEHSSPEEQSSDLPADSQIIDTLPDSSQTAAPASESSAAPQAALETSETPSDSDSPPTSKSAEIETAVLVAPGQEESALVVVLVMFAGTFLAVFLIYTMLSRGGRRNTSSTLSRQQTSSGEVSRLLKPRGGL